MAAKNLEELSDTELRKRLTRLAAAESRITREVIRHLAEYDRRKLWKADGVANLWEYSRKMLGFTEDQAAVRIRAARALQDHPALDRALELGELGASAIRRLAPALTKENAAELIAQARGKPLREVERLAAIELVRQDRAAARLEASGGAPADGAASAPVLFDAPRCSPEELQAESTSRWVRSRNPDSMRPLSGADWRVAFIAGTEFVRNVDQAKNLLARRFPDARLEDILGAGVEMVLDKLDPARRHARRQARALAKARKTAENESSAAANESSAAAGGKLSAPDGSAGDAARAPEAGTEAAGAEERDLRLRRRPHIPAALRDQVLARDGYQCAHVEPDGRRCPVRRYLEVDHIVPVALNGPTTLENLRAYCRGHNAMAAELAFGVSYVVRAIARHRLLRSSRPDAAAGSEPTSGPPP
ncbi:MAG: HNH endonuclease [Elusimicrobia bacterium]|nr:HNH endonuclease [Elusimicrobiota bacterium]